jgi:putative PEP-CTERM system integral membrane protein
MVQRLVNPRFWGYGLFWSWNLLFLVFVLFGFAPTVLPEMLKSATVNSMTFGFLICALLFTAVPIVAVGLGLTVLRRNPGRLFQLFYCVQAPLMVMLAVRFFILRELTPTMTFLITITSIGIAIMFWHLVDLRLNERSAFWHGLRLFGLTFLLIMGIYASLVIVFYAVPMGVQAVRSVLHWLTNLPSLWSMNFYFQNIQYAVFGVLSTLLLVYSGTLFVITPIVVPIIYARTWLASLRSLSERIEPRLAIALPTLALIGCVGTFGLLVRQPQHTAFAMLETAPSNQAERQHLIANEETLRAGLVNAYLSPYRYISVVGGVAHVGHMYEYSLQLSPTDAKRVQDVYELVTRPLLYERSLPKTLEEINKPYLTINNDTPRAAELYQQLFDAPILRGERTAIVRAVLANWNVSQAQMAWQAVDDREIRMTHQEVTFSEHGDWAEFELYEVYQNQTFERQEVIYYFQLPESAVITGVWLGNSPDRGQRYKYVVAPRGAAQQVYHNEVSQQFDPALVEQIGPRQYRLRVFPIEPRQFDWNTGQPSAAAPPLHMWLTWRVLANNGQWPLPQISELRNVYWDGHTTRLINRKPMAVGADEWLPTSMRVQQPAPATTHRVNFANGTTVIARPATNNDLAQIDPRLRLAVVLDRSRSMAAHAEQVQLELAWLRDLSASGATIDVYLTAPSFAGEQPTLVSLNQLESAQIFAFGGQNPIELLAQFDQLRGNRSYDTILVLTDESGYELGPSNASFAVPNAPLWMIHLGGKVSLGYDDKTLEALQASGGGVASSSDEALRRVTLARQTTANTVGSSDLIDDYVWQTLPTSAVSTDLQSTNHLSSDAFAALAARRLIVAETQRQRQTLGQLATLDQLHALAVQQSIVTPYSSMIVLINDRQREDLKRLEQQEDRFDREMDPVVDTNTTPILNGVPEPEEWLLIGLACAALLWFGYTNRRKRQLALA